MSLPFPFEITSYIFLVALQDGTESFHPAQTSLALAHVCQEWRAVATATPQLWTNIQLQSGGGGLPLLSTVQKWLAWSGSFPLTISFTITPGAGRYTNTRSRRMEAEYVHLLSQHCGRWRRAKIQLLHEESAAVLGAHLNSWLRRNNTFPVLRSFELDLSPGARAPPDPQTSWSAAVHNALLMSPYLHTLSLASWDSIVVPPSPPHSPLFLPTLRHFTLICDYPTQIPLFNPTNLIGFVQSCTNLVSLTLGFPSVQLFQWPPSFTAVELPSLTELKLSAEDYTTLAGLTDLFDAPNLTSLSFALRGDSYDDENAAQTFGPTFLEFLDSCADTLTHLTLHVGFIFGSADAHEAIINLSKLSSLVIGHAYDLWEWSELFKSLTFDFTSNCQTVQSPNPVLERFVFEIDPGVEFDAKLLEGTGEFLAQKEFLASLARMVWSRRAHIIAGNASAEQITSRQVRPLSTFGLGTQIVEAYTQDYGSLEWRSVREAWDSMSDFVDFDIYEALYDYDLFRQ
ncbi:uncharacterized protein STEHIDRAFT_156084 [Stereum hirsutum FP-91666 SS1]|uniref:uncharacterized protein n=1 Tax=Stereum hirsutum (strain FP-91666) TaxID=721885 RepID=UPI000440C1FC|nr:uncharacterized protein STEHIDRAFT_156084 [Stereum hirsutum FP-91666 SS1]EIM87094.1 hypothetical protein STEHIDRAFT_156084 [Stereum hirsutum FP-91666 SS1]